ncbi:MAG: sodium:alanine symporter family protein [Acidobacteria bacterium]|nr:sodium:alanine symporter family protein [Acidobacteriota bacterium]
MIDTFAASIDAIASALFMPWVVVALMGTAIFLTVRLGFVQFRRIGEAFRSTVAGQSAGAGGALSPVQAFMLAVAASVGTGNIAGVATAIISGGPGALFWIWVFGFFAASLKFAEATLGLTFREMIDGHVRSGPMYYLRDGLRKPWIAWTYALVAGIAALTTTPFTQPNSIAVVWESQFAIPTWVTGVIVAVLTWLVIIGGVKSIGPAMEKLAPLKVGLYLIGGVIVLVSFASELPGVFALVFREAFALDSGLGFGMFIAIRYGIARGVYATEAGYGTAAVAYGTAKSDRPSQQGLQAVMEVFIVCFITATISALTILVTGVAMRSIEAGPDGAGYLTSTAAVAAAFDAAMPVVGGWMVAFCAFLFGYGTLIGWAYYGEQFLEYIFGPRVTIPYRWIYCLLIPFGAMARVDVVWAWGDFMNALQVFPNVVGLIGLSGLVAKFAWDAKTGSRLQTPDSRPGAR